MFIAQIPGADRLIESATSHGWEAAAIAMVLIACMGAVGWFMRALWAVNQQLEKRVQVLAGKFEDHLMGQLEKSTTTIAASTVATAGAAKAITEFARVVEKSRRSQEAMVARMAAAPCLMTGVFSDETSKNLQRAKDAVKPEPA